MSRLLRLIAVACISLLVAAGAATAAIAPLRNIVIAAWNEPAGMPALDTDPRIHFERGAEACAATVAQLLPAAIGRVEAAHGRPFARPVTIGVYASFETYARANAAGTTKAAGTTAFGRVTLSPALCSTQSNRLAGVLTHELSHAHLQGWLSPFAYFALPNWFKEGLAVFLAPGDGGSQIDADAARNAIASGIQIAAVDTGSLFNLASIQFAARPDGPAMPADVGAAGLAYREAALFVAYLRDRNPTGFASFLAKIEDGLSFKTAFEASFGDSVSANWREFVAAIAKTRSAHPADRSG